MSKTQNEIDSQKINFLHFLKIYDQLFPVIYVVGPTLFGAIITPNLVPRVLEKLFSLEIVENDICLASTSKQMPFFQTDVSQKTPSTSRIGPVWFCWV